MVRALVPLVIAVVATACGRVGFDETDAAIVPLDGGADAGADSGDASPTASQVTWVGSFAQLAPLGGNTRMFDVTPAHVGDALVMLAGCTDSPAPTGVTATAPGWTIVELEDQGESTLTAASFVAIAPSTATTTFTVTWTGTACAQGSSVLGDEFTGNNPMGGTASFDGFAIYSGSDGNASAMVISETANDTLWGAAFTFGHLTDVGAGFTHAADNSSGDWSEYRVTGDPAQTTETVGFTGTGTGYVMAAIAIHPM